MSEFEYLKYNKELKGFYNAYNKFFPKQPHNKINILMKIFKQNKNEMSFKVNKNFNEVGLEMGPIIKFENGDKLVFNLNEKAFTISILLCLNYQKFLKSIDYSVSLDRNNKKLKNCIFDLKFGSLGNMVLSLNQTKKPRIESKIKTLNEGQEKIIKKTSSSACDDKQEENNCYSMKFSYSNKISKYMDTKIILNSNQKEDNIFEFKTAFDLAKTNFKFFSFSTLNFNLHKQNIKFTKNICGVNYVINQNRNDAKTKSKFKLSPGPNSSEEEKIESSSNKDDSMILTAGLILQNLKLSSTYFGAFVNRNKTSEFPISYKMGIYCSIDPIKNQKDTPINISYKISPALVSQYNYGKLCTKYKLTLDSIRLYNEWSFKQLMNIKILHPGFEKASLGVYINLENFHWTELNFSTTALNYGISLNLN